MAGLPKFNRAQVPKMAGRASATDHVLGESTRRGKYSMGPGTNLKLFGGNQAKRSRGGVSQSSAPYKHDAANFNIGIGPKLLP